MAEPTTGAAVAAAIAMSAATRFGSRVGDAIADRIFGSSSNLDDIQDLLKRQEEKIEELLFFARGTYIILQDLPDLVQGMITEQSLYHARNNINSTKQAFMIMSDWHSTIGIDTYGKLIESWNVIIDFESETENLVKIPSYAEFLLVISNGRLHKMVSEGVEDKLNALDEYVSAVMEDEVSLLGIEIEAILKSKHVKRGEILNDAPWIRWEMHGHRNRTERRCEPSRDIGGGILVGGGCYEVQKPDSTWNSSVNNKNRALTSLAERMETASRKLTSAILAREALSQYLAALDDAPDLRKDLPMIDIVDSVLAFPVSR